MFLMIRDSWKNSPVGLKEILIKIKSNLRHCVYCVYYYVRMHVFVCECVFASNEAVFVSIKREGCIITDGNSSHIR